MKIIAITQHYLPNHNAGSELMLRDILVGLRSLGNDITILCEFPGAGQVDGISVYPYTHRDLDKIVKSADVIISHLAAVPFAIDLKNKHKKPTAMIVHNNRKLNYNTVYKEMNDLLVFNSSWLLKESTSKLPSILLNPPLKVEEYRVKRQEDFITLINLNKQKGGELFWDLAHRMPHRSFLGVLGAYGEQLVPDSIPDNVVLQEHTANMKEVYSKTKILLIPSVYETWGKVGLEAACSGIPSIAHPTIGLKESLSSAGVFVDRESTDGYVRAINAMMDDDKLYLKHSRLSRKRSEEVSGLLETQIKTLELSLTALC